MPMPKASVHEERQPTRREAEVRPARKLLVVQSITQTVGVKEVPNAKLNFRILASHPRHDLASLVRIIDIHHPKLNLINSLQFK